MTARSAYEAFCVTAATFGEREFLRAPARDDGKRPHPESSRTYAEAAAEVARLRSQYAGRSLQKGERVALAFDSRIELYLHFLALNSLGASLVPLNMAGSDAEVGYVIDHSDSVLVVSMDEHADRLAAIAGDAGNRQVIASAELAAGPQASVDSAPATSAQEAALLYTSGTTGSPKGCILSNEYFLSMGRWYNGLGGRCALDSNDRLLTPLPPHHMNALCVSFMAMLLCGGCVVQLDRFHPSTWWQTVRAEGASIIHYLGVMPAILLTLPPSQEDDFSGQLKFGFGAGTDPRHQRKFEQRFGFPLLEAWSMTETGAGAVTIADREPRHVGERCIGRPSGNMEYRIVDEAGAAVRSGEPGELLVRAKGENPRKGFFSGYYKNEEATRESWKDGFFHTGDVVREGPDGSLFFVDRRKNVIRRSGENISAVEVEAVLLSHPGVANCAVTSVPDELREEEVFAFVVSAGAGQAADPDVLVDHCLAELAYFKVPGYVAFVDDLPLTASQKVSRATVKEQARARVERSECFDVRSAKSRRRQKAV